MKTVTETALVRACLDYLTLRGIPAWRANTGAAKFGKRFVRFGTPGVSDVLCVLSPHGRLGAIECKVGRNRTSEAQEAFLANVRAAGGLAVVVRSLDDLIEALEGL